jgi:hypothetical protein
VGAVRAQSGAAAALHDFILQNVEHNAMVPKSV